MASEKKQANVKSLLQLISRQENILLLGYGKISHPALEKLRFELKKQKSILRVVKNNLLEKAIKRLAEKNKNIREFAKKFLPIRNSTAVGSLPKDYSVTLKTLSDFIKKEKNISFKCALIENLTHDDKATGRIAQLPSRIELLGKIIGSFKSPTSRLVYALKFNTNKIVYILKQKGK